MNKTELKSATHCPKCLKTQNLCICESIHPQKTQVEVVILQHPQEPDHELGTARIAHFALSHSQLKVGLSWPNLKAVVGRPADPKRWVVLYLGSKGTGQKGDPGSTENLVFLSKKGNPIPSPLSYSEIEGIVLLDGTWSQAKALWWRNPWLLKLNRAMLNPKQKSLYGSMRKEPRKECLSTIESIAESLDAIGESHEVSQNLRSLFSLLLSKIREKKTGQQNKKVTPALEQE